MTQPSCPECFTEYVKRVRRESLKERLISLFYFYPFRCQLCGHRFKFLQWGVKYLRVEEDRRTYERLRLNFPVTFTRDGIQSSGTIADISMAGCAIRAAAKLDPGTILRTSLQMSPVMPPIVVEAAIVRDVRQDRVGVEFLHLKKIERDRLRDFIRNSLLKQQSGETSVTHPVTARTA